MNFFEDGFITFSGDLVDFFESRERGAGHILCSNCGWEFSNYAETGRFGCSKCYDIFHDEVAAIIRELGGRRRE